MKKPDIEIDNAQDMIEAARQLEGFIYRMWLQDDLDGYVKFNLFTSDENEGEKGILIAMDESKENFLAKVQDVFILGCNIEDGTTAEQFFEVLKQHGYPKL